MDSDYKRATKFKTERIVFYMLSAKCTVQNVCNKCHQSLPDCVPKANSQPSRVSDIEIFANPSAESTTKIYPVPCKRNFICFQAKRFNTREHTTGRTTVPKQPLFEHATDGRLVSLKLGWWWCLNVTKLPLFADG